MALDEKGRKLMIHFVSNPCGCGHCMGTECETCELFKPRFLGIPIPRKIGEWLYRLEEWLFFKFYVIKDDNEPIDWFKEEE